MIVDPLRSITSSASEPPAFRKLKFSTPAVVTSRSPLVVRSIPFTPAVTLAGTLAAVLALFTVSASATV